VVGNRISARISAMQVPFDTLTKLCEGSGCNAPSDRNACLFGFSKARLMTNYHI
jgi:hypothetical protein